MAGPVPTEEGFFRAALDAIVPYEPGKPVEEVQRELGLERVVKLASNEGPFGPFPAALEALERSARDLNRYPDGGAYALRFALADLHDVRFEEIAIGAGADGLVDALSQAVLEPGDGVVLGWPSFPSYAIYATKLGADVRKVPLREHRYDLDAMLDAIDGRTKLVYVCLPNNPTGTTNTRAELDRFLEAVPDHVLPVIDQAYFEYVIHSDYPDAIDTDFVHEERRIVVLRTFSKIFGLAGLRVGYGIAPAEVVEALSKTRRAFDITSPAQAAALASLHAADEIERRRELNAAGIVELERTLRAHGFDPPPAVGNFLYAPVGEDARPLFEELLRLGVIVRPLHGFGAADAIRVTVGTPEENAIFGEALGRVRDRVAAPS